MQSLSAICSKSATFDEVQYFGIGKYLLTEHKWDVMGALLHPPFSYYLNSLPLLFVNEDKKIWNYDVKKRDFDFLAAVDYYRGQKLLSASFNSGDKLLIASRCMTLLLALLLGIYIYRFSSYLWGENGALLSLFFFSFCPNMIAFSGICVPDMPLTVFTFIFMYYFWRALKERRKTLSIFAGVALGFALLSKVPALLLIPLSSGLTFMFMYIHRRNFIPCLLLILVVAFFVMLIGYQGDLTPFAQGLQYRQMKLNDGQAAYLWGQYSSHGWWYFYPLAFLMKTPLPLLFLFPLAIFTLCRDNATNRNKAFFLLSPIILFFIAFSLSGSSVGLRYLLPVYPFIFVLVGALAAHFQQYRYYLAIAVVWYAFSSFNVAPHYLAYFNEAFGGPDNGYKFLADSNLDWGQDLKGLKKFMDRNKIEKISLSYLGADSPGRYGIQYDWLPSYYLYNPSPEKPYDINKDQLVAVSVTNLLGVYFENRDMFKWLMAYKPVAKVGYSIYVYDLSGARNFKN